MKLFKKWTNWQDLSTGQFEHRHYLLQAKRCEDGRVKFRVASSRCAWYTGKVTIEDLAKIKTPDL